MYFLPMIDLITFDAQERDGRLIESVCGIIVSAGTDKPHVHLFEIEENTGVPISGNIFQGCSAIRDQLFPDLRLQDIEWRLTKSIFDTKIRFEEVQGWPVSVQLDHEIDFGASFKFPLSSYENALLSADGFEHYLTSGHGFSERPPLHIVPVPLNAHPRGYMLFKREREGDAYGNMVRVVLADAQKIHSFWRDQAGEPKSLSKGFNYNYRQQDTGDDSVLLNCSLESSLQYLNNQSATRMKDMTYISFSDGELSFINGRHRLFNAINAGAPFVPVEIDIHSGFDKFTEKFEWKPSNKQLGSPVSAFIPSSYNPA